MKFIGAHIFDYDAIFRGSINIGSSTSPSKKLTVTTSTTGDGILGVSTDGNNWLRLQNDNSAAFPVGTLRLYYGTNQNVKITALSNEMKLGDSQNNMTFFTASAERMRLNSTGLGIGTSSPSQLIDVASSGTNTSAPTIRITNTANNSASNWNGKISHAIEFYSDDPSRVGLASSIQNIAGTDKGGVLTGNITFNTNDWPDGTGIAERMRITDGGNVGIGTSSPSQKLTVEGNIELGTGGYIYGDTTTPYLRLNNAAGAVLGYSNGYISLGPTFVYNNASGEQFRIRHSDGSVGIGTSNPASKLDVRGTVQVGVDDTGHDVIFYGATSGKKMQWDESADTLIVDGTLDVNGPFEIDKTLTMSHTADPSDPATGKSVMWSDTSGNLKIKINVAGSVVTRTLAAYED